MNLYIQVENGEPINHPAFEDNLIQAFGSVPSNWEPFNRVNRPILSIYQLFESDDPIYQKINGVWTDVWLFRDMTSDEKASLIAKVQANPPGPNLILNTDTLDWEPNTPMPNDGKNYFWHPKKGMWVEYTPTT